jgi:hypothetical protein
LAMGVCFEVPVSAREGGLGALYAASLGRPPSQSPHASEERLQVSTGRSSCPTGAWTGSRRPAFAGWTSATAMRRAVIVSPFDSTADASARNGSPHVRVIGFGK